ncbi:ABC transporter permease [Microaceticoccus formicicus]|uniref:ABC transporter permease n=1 Tax=Microaceticoccus formicicus TaxID=3118105 RepID=UPI003CD02F8B|nr:ABC transporter permease subunit [Peptoniphilaceae bacterium AMB_02]
MTHYIAFLKKEILESIRTYKLLIMLIVFVLIGVMNPFTAKLTPHIIKTLIPEGNSISIPEATALDSWAQFFKNIAQMGLIVTILVFSGILVTELSKGTLINMLTKGLSRKAVILSKFTFMTLIWTLSVTISFIITWAYTVYLFPGDRTNNLLFSVFCLWLFGLFLLSLLMFSSTVTNTNYGSLIIVGVTVVIGMLLNIIPSFQKYNPISLSTRNMELLTNTLNPTFLYSSIGVTVIIIIVLMTLSILIFRKKEIQ